MSWITNIRGISVSLHLGIVATGIAYLLFAKGLTQVASSTAVTLALAEPLTAALLGVFIVGETLNTTSWIGIFLLMLGIGILIWGDRKSTRLNSSHVAISYAVFCLKRKNTNTAI